MQTVPFFMLFGKQAVAKLAAVLLALSLVLMSTPGAVSAQSATTFNLMQVMPVVYSEYVPCAAGGAGEMLNFSGSLKMTIHGTLTGDGRATFSAKMVPLNVVGVGQTTGDQYQLVGETGTTRTYTIDFGQSERWTTVEHFRFVTPGAGNDYVTMTVYHEIVNADGEPFDTVERVTVECQ